MDNMTKTKKKATIFDGHSHIERRVYEDKNGFYCVKINGIFFKVIELHHFDIDIWYDG